MGKVRITATFEIDDECSEWTNEGDAIEGFRKLVEEDLSEYYHVDNLKVVAEDDYCISVNDKKNKAKKTLCPSYHSQSGKPHCWGTKNGEECSCQGNKKACNFYRYDENGKYIGLK